MSLRGVMRGLSVRTQGEVLGLWRRHRSGLISRDQFVALAAMVIARADARAVSLADTALAGWLSRSLGQPVPPIGFTPVDETDRLASAVSTVLDDEVVTAVTAEERAASQSARLGRLSKAEPLAKWQDAFMLAMTAQGVGGWTRSLGAKPCPLCVTLADGVVRSPSIPFARHPGCSCVQLPVL